MESMDRFINEIIQVRKTLDLREDETLIELTSFNRIINGLSYRVTNPRAIGLVKKMATMLNNKKYLDYDDVIQETLLCIILSIVHFDIRKEYTIEESIHLFLAPDNSSDEEIIKVSKFYRLLELKVKQYLAIILNYRKRKQAVEIYGEEIRVVSFNEIIGNDSEEPLEDFIDRLNINSNFYAEEVVDNTLLQWLEEKKINLTKGQREYLLNPLKFSPSSRTSYQRKIEKKIADEAIKEFGTTKEKVVKDLIIYKVLDNVLGAKEFQEELVNNIEILEELIYTTINDIEILKDITLAIRDINHTCSNSSLIAVSKVLWDKFYKLEDKINNIYKINSEQKKEELVKKRFNINLVEGIDTSDSDTYKKRANGKNIQSWERFRNMHKRAYENNQKLNGDFLSYSKFCKWLEENEVKGEVSRVYYANEDDLTSDKAYILPVAIINFLEPVSIRYDKADKTYKGVFKWDNKYHTFYSVDNPEELKNRVRKEKTIKLREIAKSKKDILSGRSYIFLSEEFEF